MRIASFFALAGLGLSTQALAAPTLSVSGSCGGATTAVTDATNYRLVFGEAGAYTIPGGSCADIELGVMGSASAPMSDSETTFVLNEAHCGASAQVIDMDTCEVSAVVVLPTENAYDMGYDDGYDAGLEDAVCDITSNDEDICEDAGGTWDDGVCTAAVCDYTLADVTSAYEDGYTAGFAAAPTPESNDESICTAAGGTWDGSDCTAAASEEAPQCFLSGVCSYFGAEAPAGHVDSGEAADISASCHAQFEDGFSLAPVDFIMLSVEGFSLLCVTS